MKTKERILWVDIYKVLAISLVVLGHMHLNEKLNIAIYSFHMFAFFLISGYCTKDKMGGKKPISIFIRMFLFH